jgi:predicted PurR-regulated permease PerM
MHPNPQSADDRSTTAAGEGSPPPWVPKLIRQGIWWTIFAVLVTLVALWLLGEERELVRYLVAAGLLALALEPGVIWLHEKRGFRRGSATALLLITLVLGVILFAIGMSAVLAREASQVVDQLPTYIDKLNAFTEDHFNTTLVSASQRAEAAQGMTHVNDYLKEHTQDILGGVTSIVSGIFSIFTIGFFAFFLTKDGPKVRRVLLSLLTPERQQRVLFAWETAIRKVGGYLYSRLLLAVINAGLMFITLKIVGAPFALPLALFEGLVAAFIPIIGTYVGGVLPVLVVLAERGPSAAVVVVAELLLYQLVENYYLSPRISARTIELNAGVAFGAAMAGGAVGGFLGAFFALPIAATIQKFLSAYSKTYDVADSASTRVDEPPEYRPRRLMSGARRWIRRSKVETPDEEVRPAEALERE